MKSIKSRADSDIPLYFKDFSDFWNTTLSKIKSEDKYKCYHATLIFKNWKLALISIDKTRCIQILDELYEDINSSLYLGFLGLYRSSHMHMRSSIELTLQLIYFIDHPVEFTRWLAGDFIIKHSDLITYLENHPKLNSELGTIVEQITRNWKYFSKHIHGESPIFFQCEKDVAKTNSFSQKDFGPWKKNFLDNINLLNRLMLLFFKDEINRFPETTRKILLELMQERDLKNMGLST